MRRVIERYSDADRNVGAAGDLKHLGCHPSAVGGIAGCGGHQPQVELRAAQQESERPDVVHVEADVGVKDHRDGHGVLSCRSEAVGRRDVEVGP